MSGYTVVCDYPYAVEAVWDVLTAPDQVARWTTTGRGGAPEGFLPVVGTRFRFVGRPTLGWAGTVYGEVEAVAAPHLLRYTWRGEPGRPADHGHVRPRGDGGGHPLHLAAHGLHRGRRVRDGPAARAGPPHDADHRGAACAGRVRRPGSLRSVSRSGRVRTRGPPG